MSAIDHGGSGSAYVYGCRCDLCTEANRRRCAKARARRRQQKPPADAHGKSSTYCNWGCRCDPCSAAQAVKQAHYRRLRAIRKEEAS